MFLLYSGFELGLTIAIQCVVSHTMILVPFALPNHYVVLLS